MAGEHGIPGSRRRNQACAEDVAVVFERAAPEVRKVYRVEGVGGESCGAELGGGERRGGQGEGELGFGLVVQAGEMEGGGVGSKKNLTGVESFLFSASASF